MIAEERLPSLRWGPPVPCHVFGDRGLANFDAELEELTVDPGGVQHFPVFSDIFHFILRLCFSKVLVIFLFTRALSAIPLFSNLW
jgi:hypothetical protein